MILSACNRTNLFLWFSLISSCPQFWILLIFIVFPWSFHFQYSSQYLLSFMEFKNEFCEGTTLLYHLAVSKMILHKLLAKSLHFQITIQFLVISRYQSVKMIASVSYYFSKTMSLFLKFNQHSKLLQSLFILFWSLMDHFSNLKNHFSFINDLKKLFLINHPWM